MEQQALDDVIDKLARALNISRYKVLNDSGKTTFGENFFGTLTPLRIECVKQNETVKYNVIIKTPPNNELLREKGFVTMMYENEINFYTKLMPVFQKINREIMFPKCYYACKEKAKEVLVIQDMTNEGYEVKNEMFLNLEHGMLVVENMAMFHAVSLTIEENNKDLYKTIKDCIALDFEKSELFDEFVQIVRNAYKKIIPKIVGEPQKIMSDLVSNIDGHLSDIHKKTKIQAMNHGDLWKNNVLFKYENDKPSSVCFVDYQMVRECPVVYDLLYFISSSIEPKIRRKHFHDFVQRYRETLNSYLKKFNPNNKKFSFDALESDLKVVAPALLVLTVFSFKNWCKVIDEDENIFQKKKSVDLETAWTNFTNIVQDLIADYKDLELI